jgi:hypothetical protein
MSYTELTWQKIKARNKLFTSDDIGFTKEQVANDIFGKGYAPGYFNYGKSLFEIKPKEILPDKNFWFWFPKLWIPHCPQDKNWKNTIEDNGRIFRQEYIGTGKQAKKRPLEPVEIFYVFAKGEDKAYRFKGEFVLIEREDIITVYEKISDELDMSKFTNQPKR